MLGQLFPCDFDKGGAATVLNHERNQFFVEFSFRFLPRDGVYVGKVQSITPLLERALRLPEFESYFDELYWLATTGKGDWELTCVIGPDVENDKSMCADIRLNLTRGNKTNFPPEIIDAANQLVDELDLVLEDDGSGWTKIPYLNHPSSAPDA